jgi:hypothetical protein
MAENIFLTYIECFEAKHNEDILKRLSIVEYYPNTLRIKHLIDGKPILSDEQYEQIIEQYK